VSRSIRSHKIIQAGHTAGFHFTTATERSTSSKNGA